MCSAGTKPFSEDDFWTLRQLLDEDVEWIFHLTYSGILWARHLWRGRDEVLQACKNTDGPIDNCLILLFVCHPERSEGSTRSDSRTCSWFKQTIALARPVLHRFAKIPRLHSE
jgi:hypothetical protein